MNQRLIFIITLYCLLCVLQVAWAEGENSDNFDAVSLYIENDTTAGEDKYYTSGVKMTWISKTLSDRLLEKKNSFIDKIPCFNSPDHDRVISVSVGQSIYTPENLERKDLIEDDRPYAGISYFSFGLHAKEPFRKDAVEFILGVVGPRSLAEDCQAEMHSWVGLHPPQGWDNQIHNEFVVGIAYEQERDCIKTAAGEDYGSDVGMHFGGGLGNAATYLNCGATFRLGLNLPDDFNHYRIRPVSSGDLDSGRSSSNTACGKGSSVFCFLSVDAQVVFRNIFLDGNTFRDSHSVDKKPFVADFMAGVAYAKGRYAFSLAQVFRSKEFEGQEHDHVYGSLNFSFIF